MYEEGLELLARGGLLLIRAIMLGDLILSCGAGLCWAMTWWWAVDWWCFRRWTRVRRWLGDHCWNRAADIVGWFQMVVIAAFVIAPLLHQHHSPSFAPGATHDEGPTDCYKKSDCDWMFLLQRNVLEDMARDLYFGTPELTQAAKDFANDATEVVHLQDNMRSHFQRISQISIPQWTNELTYTGEGRGIDRDLHDLERKRQACERKLDVAIVSQQRLRDAMNHAERLLAKERTNRHTWFLSFWVARDPVHWPGSFSDDSISHALSRLHMSHRGLQALNEADRQTGSCLADLVDGLSQEWSKLQAMKMHGSEGKVLREEWTRIVTGWQTIVASSHAAVKLSQQPQAIVP